MTEDHLRDQVRTLINLGVHRQAEAMTLQLRDILGRCATMADVYSVCCRLGAYGATALKKLHREEILTGDGYFGIDSERSDSNDPAFLFATRFITACVNSDHDMMNALFHTAQNASDREAARSIASLAMETASLVGAALLKEQAESGVGTR